MAGFLKSFRRSPAVSGIDVDEAATEGMKVVFEGERPVKADVIFVHGLRGDSIRTWSHGDTCWPRDLLPSKLEDHARILTWGYDSQVANVISYSSQNTIFGHGGRLFDDIVMERQTDEERSRPIVFVGHSLGGLVIKEALIEAQQYWSNEQRLDLGIIYKSTTGVVFLATPHRGSDKAGLAELVVNIARFTMRQPNSHLVAALDPDSETLEHQHEAFSSISKNMPIVCINEEKPTGVGMIVPKESAVMDGFDVPQQRTGATINATKHVCLQLCLPSAPPPSPISRPKTASRLIRSSTRPSYANNKTKPDPNP